MTSCASRNILVLQKEGKLPARFQVRIVPADQIRMGKEVASNTPVTDALPSPALTAMSRKRKSRLPSVIEIDSGEEDDETPVVKRKFKRADVAEAKEPPRPQLQVAQPEMFYVDRLLAHVIKNDQVYYLVKWTKGKDTLEPAVSLFEDVPQLLIEHYDLLMDDLISALLGQKNLKKKY